MTITQCLLGKGNERTVSWIETPLARVGRRLKKINQTWEVLEVWQTLDEQAVNEWRPPHWRTRS